MFVISLDKPYDPPDIIFKDPCAKIVSGPHPVFNSDWEWLLHGLTLGLMYRDRILKYEYFCVRQSDERLKEEFERREKILIEIIEKDEESGLYDKEN